MDYAEKEKIVLETNKSVAIVILAILLFVSIVWLLNLFIAKRDLKAEVEKYQIVIMDNNLGK